jgi:hypothetical protein
VLLLELLELLQPGCVDWRLANKLPFKMGGARVQLLALENCQMALQIAKVGWGRPDGYSLRYNMRYSVVVL